MKAIKESLTCTLNDNIDKKAIVYCNVAKSVTTIRDSLDDWLNQADNKIEGDTLLINGDLESEWKFFSSQKFTETSITNRSMINKETYFPRILIATSGCIGAGLDSSDVHLVVRDGSPSSILDFIQEMGRCGRTRNIESNDINKDSFHLVVTISSLVYMIERIYGSKDVPRTDDDTIIDKIVSDEEVRSFQLENILSVVALMFLHPKSCWHNRIEQTCILPSMVENSNDTASNENTIFNRCNNACPSCVGTYTSYLKGVSRIGLTQFLVQTFILNQSGIITPTALVKKLKEYRDVGKIVYKKRVGTPPTQSYLNGTVLQLMSSKIQYLSHTAICDTEVAISR